jgi:hypothetical protein
LRKPLIALFAILGCQWVMAARQNLPAKRLADADIAIVLVVEQEVRVSHLEKRRDVCIGFGHGLVVDQDGILSELNSRGMKLRPNEWCNEGPRGSVVAIISPIGEPGPDTYELTVELGDLRGIKQKGDHFGTLLRRGIYTVQIDDRGKLKVIAYRKTCCPEQAMP